MTHTLGFTILVESNLPPRPTSRTAASTFSSTKYSNAKAVVISKKVGSSFQSFTRVLISLILLDISLSEIGFPFTRMRSQNEMRCGDVKSPVFFPQCLKIESIKAHVEPLPFVPAT